MNLNATAPTASLPNWPGGTSPARHAATPSTKALEPLMRVRSRSKNAALGPLATYCDDRVSVSVGRFSDSSDIATHRQCEVVDASLGNLELADYSLNRILAAVALEGEVQSGTDLVVADLATRRRTFQDDHILAARRRRSRCVTASSSVPRHTDSYNLVSSRATATASLAAARRGEVVRWCARRGAAPRTSPSSRLGRDRGEPVARSRPERGRKPSKTNRWCRTR